MAARAGHGAAGRGPGDLTDTAALVTAVRRAVRAAALARTRAGAQPPSAADVPLDRAVGW